MTKNTPGSVRKRIPKKKNVLPAPLTVGLSVIPPLVTNQGERCAGFETELWEAVAKKLALTFAYREYEFSDMLDAVRNQKVDIAFDELRTIGAHIVPVKNIDQAYPLLEKKSVDAIVFDAPVLLHYMNKHPDAPVAPIHTAFATQTYGFAFPLDSTIRESVNRVLLELHESGEYDALYTKWFGPRIV